MVLEEVQESHHYQQEFQAAAEIEPNTLCSTGHIKLTADTEAWRLKPISHHTMEHQQR